MTLVKANWTDTITVAVNGADVDVIVVTLGKANRTDVVANNVALVKANYSGVDICNRNHQ